MCHVERDAKVNHVKNYNFNTEKLSLEYKFAAV